MYIDSHCCHWIQQEPSVDLALKILDGTPLRPGGQPIMSVTRAKFEQKGMFFLVFVIYLPNLMISIL